MQSMLSHEISRAIDIVRESFSAEDYEIFQNLVNSGIERRRAARLVEFLPMVYCRILLSDSGARFAKSFRRPLPDGGLSAETPFSAEPIWEAALAFAKAEVEHGLLKKDLLFLAGRSAEFDAANQLLQKGSELRNVVFSVPVLNWPENGADSDPQAQR
jgi:hypothetical protein